MLMQNFWNFILFFILITTSYSQKKSLQAHRINEKISIDGKLEEISWKNAPIASDFIMFDPDNGSPIKPEKQTDVKILYDDDAIYVGALLRDEDPSKIMAEITQRDNFGTADMFGIFINGFNDGQQDFRFLVSAAGTQMDCLATESDGEDFTWDGIWDSSVKITPEGWVVEMKIPYAALRFSNEKKQTWAVNFFRELRRDRQKYTWSRFDRNIGAFIPQHGKLEGIENIKPPTRLFLIPYSSAYYEKTQNSSQTLFKAGMDVKYGINDSFTLDAILVPDFGQVAFDNVILNLSPFEQQFNENRPFFTEGTDLFNKGGLFYSRRIGGFPTQQIQLNDNEFIQSIPSAVNLLNATKISGRDKNGLGIGFLNATTEKTEVIINNSETGETRTAIAEPLTNYNITVFDQRFNENSSVTIINTNVTRNGNYRDANVTGLIFGLNTTKNTYSLNGALRMSSVYDTENYNGIDANINFAKTYGKVRYSIGSQYVSKDYDINDLGINFITNFKSFFGNLSYRILNPTKIFNTFSINSNYYTEFQNDTGKPQAASFNLNINSTSKKNDYLGGGLFFTPIKIFDFYEPRVEGRFLEIPESIGAFIYFSSNFNRKFALDLNPYFEKFNQNRRLDYGFSINPRYRFSDKLNLIYTSGVDRQKSDVGWVDFDNNAIILAERDRTTFTNTLTGKYGINSNMTINLSLRHYWSFAENIDYLNLNEDGSFVSSSTYNGNRDANFSTWNFDLSYTWWFAPGSQITALYRNNALDFSREINKNFNSNIGSLFQNNLNHVFSLSLRYFIDFNQAKNWLKKV